MMSCHAQEEQPVAYNELDATKTPGMLYYIYRYTSQMYIINTLSI